MNGFNTTELYAQKGEDDKIYMLSVFYHKKNNKIKLLSHIFKVKIITFPNSNTAIESLFNTYSICLVLS